MAAGPDPGVWTGYPLWPVNPKIGFVGTPMWDCCTGKRMETSSRTRCAGWDDPVRAESGYAPIRSVRDLVKGVR